MNKVTLVVDKNYGQRLLSLVETGAVWIVDTEANRKAAETCWSLDPEANVTTFKYLDEDSASEICLGILDVIDLHHGKDSDGYSVLELIGVQMKNELRAAIMELGFNAFVKTEEGFRASR